MNLPRILPAASALVLLLGGPARAQDPEEVIGQGKDGQDIRRKDLRPFADFGEAVFKKGTVFGEVNLSHANFFKARLVGVDLSEATLLGANLTQASLVGSKVPLHALEGSLVILRDTLGPRAERLSPSPMGKAPVGVVQAGALAASPAEGKAAKAPAPGPATPAPPGASKGFESRYADLRAFFDPGQPKGTLKELFLGDDEPYPTRLAAYADGLAYTVVGSDLIRFLGPHGWAGVHVGEVPADLGGAGPRVWWASSRKAAFSLMDTPSWAGRQLQRTNPKVIAMDLGEMPLRFSNNLAVIDGQAYFAAGVEGQPVLQRVGLPSKKTAGKLLKDGPATAGRTMEAMPVKLLGRNLYRLDPAPNGSILINTEAAIGLFDSKARTLDNRQPKGFMAGKCRPVLTADGRLWYVTARPGEIGVQEPGGGAASTLLLKGSEGGDRSLITAMAAGPDGSLWFTQTGLNRVGWLEPGTLAEHEVEGLAALSFPLTLINGGDGNMYFTMLGARRLGAVAGGQPAMLAAAAQSSIPQEKEPEPDQPAPAAGAGAGRQALATTAGSAPAAAAAAPPARPQDQKQAAGKAAAAVDPVPGQPAAVPATEAQLRKLLATRGITSVAWQHIWERHGYYADNQASQFRKSDNSKRDVLSLVYRTLAAPSYPTHRLLMDIRGNYPVWRKFDEPIGFIWDRGSGKWVATSILKVVLSGRKDTVITAYPVKDF